MKKQTALKKAMEIIAMKNVNPNRIEIKKVIKDDILIRGMQQVIPNSQFYYSADSDKIYTIIADKVMQIGVVEDEKV